MEEQITRIFKDVLDIDEVDIRPMASLVDDLGADSVDMVELVQRIEKEFKIHITDSDLPNLQTVQMVFDFVRARLRSDT
jgi:acyl carrier protein